MTNKAVGILSDILDQVLAKSPFGEERDLQKGDAVYSGDLLFSENDFQCLMVDAGVLSISGGSSLYIDDEIFSFSEHEASLGAITHVNNLSLIWSTNIDLLGTDDFCQRESVAVSR